MSQSISQPAQLAGTPRLVSLLQGSSAFANSSRVWLVLVAYLAIIKVVVDSFFPAALAADDQRAVFSWPVIAVMGGFGLVGVALMHRTGFPAALDPRVSNRARVLVPAAIGFALGALQVGVDLATGYTRLADAAHGVQQQYTGFWPMLLVFTAVPVMVEALYRFLLVPLVLWLVSSLLLRGRAQQVVFWILAALTSLWEPLTQTTVIDGIGPLLFAVLLSLGWLLNFAEAATWRRAGILAPFALRVAFYLVWHVAYVH